MFNEMFPFVLKKLFFLIGLILFNLHCIGDLYFDTKNNLDDSKVTRDYAVRQFYGAVIVKRSLCPQNIDFVLSSASAFTTALKPGCNGVSVDQNSEQSLRSCRSVHAYVEKKDLLVCLNEVLFFPCETIQKANLVLRPNFPVCRGLFGPGPAAPLSM